MIVMAYCEGGDLCRYLRQQDSLLDEQNLVEWLVQICMALQYLHSRNILHRDLKACVLIIYFSDFLTFCILT